MNQVFELKYLAITSNARKLLKSEYIKMNKMISSFKFTVKWERQAWMPSVTTEEGRKGNVKQSVEIEQTEKELLLSWIGRQEEIAIGRDLFTADWGRGMERKSERCWQRSESSKTHLGLYPYHLERVLCLSLVLEEWD